MNREDLDKWIKELKDDGKVVDIKVVDFNEETGEANVLIKPIKTPERIEIDWAEERRKEVEELGLEFCEQCDEQAWDGRICHACGAKDI